MSSKVKRDHHRWTRDITAPQNTEIDVTGNLTLDISAILPAQTSKLALDGSNIGGVSLDIALKKLYFENLEANIIT